MKKGFALFVLLALFVTMSQVHADEATTTIVQAGGHRAPVVAGFIDSVNNKGAWLLENNDQVTGKISYIVANPTTPEEIRVKETWVEAIANWFHTK